MLYLGRPGALVALPDPAPGVSATLARVFGEHTTLGGGRVVDFTGAGRRTFRLRWERLTDAEYALLEAFHSGSFGPGPFVFLPADAAWNYLTANQAAAGDVLGDASGFSAPGDGQSVAAQRLFGLAPLVGSLAIAWTVPANPTDADLFVGTVPVLPDVPVSFSAHARATNPVQARAAVHWYAPGGVDLGRTTGDPATIGPAGWTRLEQTAARVAGSATHCVPLLTLTPATVNADTVVSIDALRLDLGPPAPAWRPGRGVPLVSITELTDRYPWADLHDCDMTLVEVG